MEFATILSRYVGHYPLASSSAQPMQADREENADDHADND